MKGETSSIMQSSCKCLHSFHSSEKSAAVPVHKCDDYGKFQNWVARSRMHNIFVFVNCLLGSSSQTLWSLSPAVSHFIHTCTVPELTIQLTMKLLYVDRGELFKGELLFHGKLNVFVPGTTDISGVQILRERSIG